jgi:hypothetical protein
MVIYLPDAALARLIVEIVNLSKALRKNSAFSFLLYSGRAKFYQVLKTMSSLLWMSCCKKKENGKLWGEDITVKERCL